MASPTARGAPVFLSKRLIELLAVQLAGIHPLMYRKKRVERERRQEVQQGRYRRNVVVLYASVFE